MSIEAMAWVLNHSTTVGTEKVIMLGIASHADADGRNAWPSVDTLARYANVDRRTAQRAIKRLADQRHISIEAQGGGSRSTPGRYAPNLYTIPGAAPAPPLDVSGAAPEAVRGGVSRRSGAALVPPESSLELSIEPSYKTHGGYAASSTLAAFEAFWQDYPKPRRVDKKRAYRAFTEAAKEDADVATGLERWLNFWKDAGTETQFIPWATTWLNQRRWETEPGPGRPQRTPNGATVARRPNMITDRTIPEGIE